MVTGLVVALCLAAPISATAGPNCQRKADHPACGDGGDGGDSGGESCAIDATNPPAFAYAALRKYRGGERLSLHLSNADGTCTQSLAVDDVKDPSFHFDAASGTGAVTYESGSTERLYFLRFMVTDTSLVAESPILVAEYDECCVSSDVMGPVGNELISVSYVRDYTGDTRRGVEIIDLGLCNQPDGAACSGSAVNTVLDLTTSARDQCMASLANEVGLGGSYLIGDCYRPTDAAGPHFSADGREIYFEVATTGDLGDSYGVARLVRDTGPGCGSLKDLGTGWCGPQLVAIESNVDAAPRVGGLRPSDGMMVVDYDDGIEGGLRNIRIGFIDPDMCLTETASGNHWTSCLATGLPSGIVKGAAPSWMPAANNTYDVLYGGFESSTLDTVRAFSPTVSVSNDRNLLQKARSATSGF